MESLRILIADDESIRLLSLRAQLAALGHIVVAEASNGEEAVVLAASTQPDLAIIDIRMPVADGIEAAQRITEARPIPIILLTAYSEAQLVERAAQANIAAYLMKPVSGPTTGSRRPARSAGGTQVDRARQGYPDAPAGSERGRSISAPAAPEPKHQSPLGAGGRGDHHGRPDAIGCSLWLHGFASLI
jgi:CheY-like chemotaxis protein